MSSVQKNFKLTFICPSSQNVVEQCNNRLTCVCKECKCHVNHTQGFNLEVVKENYCAVLGVIDLIVVFCIQGRFCY